MVRVVVRGFDRTWPLEASGCPYRTWKSQPSGVLVVSGEPGWGQRVTEHLWDRDIKSACTSTVAEARRFLDRYDADFVVVDLELADAVRFIAHVRVQRQHVQIIALTRHPETTSAREALAHGATALLDPDVDLRRLHRLFGPSGPQSAPSRLRQARAERERQLIEEALERSNGNQSEAARQLGISRMQLWRKLGRRGRPPPER